MAEYKFEWRAEERLHVAAVHGSPLLRFQVQDGSEIDLGHDQLRALRDQITAHLGDAAPDKPLPVGTIVVGTGLTEAQMKHLPSPTVLKNIENNLWGRNNTFIWRDTAEGDEFWRDIHTRIAAMVCDVEAELARREEAAKRPKRTDVGAFSVTTSSAAVDLRGGGYAPSSLSPSYARELAAALVKHADAAEKV